MHVALGRTYRGRKVRKGTVVYLALEGGNGFRCRVEAWRREHLADYDDKVTFYLLTVPVDLIADYNELIEAIKAQLNGPVDAVVIDTLNRSLNGSENDSEDMAAYIRAADRIRTTFSCTVAIVHHCGIDGSRPRGHTSLTGAADAQLMVERDAADNITVTVEFMKDGPQGDTIVSRLKIVEVGTDEDGDAITS